jgi:DNA-directed RNA polymerase sigma subunit (sigma70/sigma32)
MGRGNVQTLEQVTPRRSASEDSSLRRLVERLDLSVGRARSALAAGGLALDDPERYTAQLARALGVLPPYDQRSLVRAARSYEGPREQWVRKTAAELLVLTNYGLITDYIRLYAARGLEEQVLRREAESAVPVAIAKFDFDKGANFVTYLLERMRHSVGSAVRTDSRLVRLKSEMGLLAEKIQRAEGLLLREGKLPTAAAIAELVSSTPERVAEVQRWLEMSYVSLDAPIGEEGQSFAEVIADPTPHFSSTVAEESEHESVAAALAQLPASQRYLLSRIVGLDGECCEQKDFVRGVYVDRDGNRFTSERSVARDQAGVIKRERAVLVRLLEQGVVAYAPLNDQTKSLYELLKAEGATAPPSIDQVEAMLKEAKRTLRESNELQGAREALRYRGDDVIKHSAEARALIRRELALRLEQGGAVDVPGLGLVDVARARTLQGPSERNDSDESELTRAAVFFGLVDAETRRLTGAFSPETLEAARTPEYEQPRPQVAQAERATGGDAARRAPQVHRTESGRRVLIADLIGAGLLRNETLVARYKGRLLEAELENGAVVLSDGRRFQTLSAAAEAVLGRPEGGWTFWQVKRGEQLVSLDSLRDQLLAA